VSEFLHVLLIAWAVCCAVVILVLMDIDRENRQ
jgi:hypothetical protein